MAPGICEECEGMVRSAREIFEEIVKASRKFKEVQEQVIRKMNQSLEEDHSDSWKSRRENKRKEELKVSDSCREFVSNHEYGHFRDPFILGDMEAERARKIRKSTVEAPDLVDGLEHDADNHFDDHFDDLQAPESEDPNIHTRNISSQRKSRTWMKKRLTSEGAFLAPDGKVHYRCQVPGCDKILKTKVTYKRHKRLHSTNPGTSLSCGECGTSFGTQGRLNLHLKSAHQITPPPTKIPRLKCPHCPLQITSTKLKLHIDQVHKKSYQFHCELCGKRDRGPWEFKYHQAYAHHICSVETCKITCENRQNLRSHQLELHGKEIDVFKCDECTKLFVKKRHLRTHKEIHHHQKSLEETGGNMEEGGKFICDLCGKRFRIQKYLNYHIWHTHNKMRAKNVK